jgi:hypothetical protein
MILSTGNDSDTRQTGKKEFNQRNLPYGIGKQAIISPKDRPLDLSHIVENKFAL